MLKKADWTQYRQEIERKLSSRHLPTDCQKYKKLFLATLLKAASHHIPTDHDGGAIRPTQAGPNLVRLSTMNDDITKATSDQKKRQLK